MAIWLDVDSFVHLQFRCRLAQFFCGEKVQMEINL